MSWVMADRVGQSEHHYSAGFFSPPLPTPPPPLTKDYFSTAVRHYAELFTSVSAGIRRKATGGCGVRLHLMLKKTLNEVTNHTDFMKHECIMSVLWLEALQQLV